ncbi:MAG: GIY-YIG nuclease family protein [Hyphomonadaceae bacterium]
MIFYGLHRWRGESGRRYMFRSVLTKHGIPDDSGGIYVFVRRRLAFFLEPLYVGKAANLRSRLLGHEKWGTAWWVLGATERHIMRVETEEERRKIEEDLIRGLRPRMNDIQIPRSENDAPNTPALRRKWEWRRKIESLLSGFTGGGRDTPVERSH